MMDKIVGGQFGVGGTGSNDLPLETGAEWQDSSY